MAARDPRFDAYIEKAQPFARPILKRLRAIVHEACPGVEESLKWRHPSFGWHGILCGMAAFKAHCVFGFWKHALVVERAGPSAAAALEKLGRLTELSDLPSKALLVRCTRIAMELNETGARSPMSRRAKPRPAATVPADLRRALQGNSKAKAAFQGFSPSHRREYVEWITEARSADTRERRLATAIEWLAQGKPRHWKYMKSW